MEAEDIERYLAELGTELKNRELNKPVRVLLIGGAYMLLLANAPRSTKDIDIFWLDEDGLQRAYAPLRESVQIIKQRHNLDADWLNYLAQMLMYDEVIVPDGKLWKRFGHTCYRADEKSTPRALSMLFAGSLKENEGKHVV